VPIVQEIRSRIGALGCRGSVCKTVKFPRDVSRNEGIGRKEKLGQVESSQARKGLTDVQPWELFIEQGRAIAFTDSACYA
jgi:hypothetical protein